MLGSQRCPQDVRSDHWIDPSIHLGRKSPNITTTCFFLTSVFTNFTALQYFKFLLYWGGWTLTCCQNNILHFYSTCGCSRMEHCCWACTQLFSHDRFILSVPLKVSMCMEIALVVLHIQTPHILQILADTWPQQQHPIICALSIFTIIIS